MQSIMSDGTLRTYATGELLKIRTQCSNNGEEVGVCMVRQGGDGRGFKMHQPLHPGCQSYSTCANAVGAFAVEEAPLSLVCCSTLPRQEARA